uniref:NADH-ubiquinone oxidoreductase chain 6 n=1 Tax=Athous haemorrhoidalis TaxID=195169 RepID=A0A191ZR18_9COLE|nr:NADH dehydrogenase subunit 6 [Athous haemorrhoidalis]
MLKMLLMMTLMMSIVFAFMSHPLSMGLILLTQVTLIASITGLMGHNFWFSYILFMVMIGGMLVLFIYMTSVASNEKFMYSNKLTIMIMLTITLTLLTMITDPFMNYQLLNTMDLSQSNMSVNFYMSLSKYFNFPTNWIMILMIIYLLVTLIAVVKITNITYGPLRQKF